jgi:hypothetical protein
MTAKQHGHNNECCEYPPTGFLYLGVWDLLDVPVRRSRYSFPVYDCDMSHTNETFAQLLP